MVKILREADKAPVVDVAKKHGIAEQTLYAWRLGELEELAHLLHFAVIDDDVTADRETLVSLSGGQHKRKRGDQSLIGRFFYVHSAPEGLCQGASGAEIRRKVHANVGRGKTDSGRSGHAM